MSSLMESTGLESTVKKSRKIKISLKPIQINLIKRWMGHPDTSIAKQLNICKKLLKKRIGVISKPFIAKSLAKWLKEIPY